MFALKLVPFDRSIKSSLNSSLVENEKRMEAPIETILDTEEESPSMKLEEQARKTAMFGTEKPKTSKKNRRSKLLSKVPTCFQIKTKSRRAFVSKKIKLK